MKKKIKQKIITVCISIMTLVSFLMTGCGSNVPDDNYRNYYEIFVGSFYDSDGNGIGDLNGISEKLDYIKDLGCNGIWLTPIMPSTTYHKYDVIDYCDVDSELGTIDDFKKLVKACHKKDIRIIIDMVINHSSAENRWFLEASSYLKSLPEGENPDTEACPYVDYYHFSKEYPGNGWCKLDGTDYYYECQFWDQMPDLNLDNPNLMKELQGIFDFWIDLGVDGFRMDAPLHYEEGDTEFNCRILNSVYEYCKSKNPDFYMVSEVWASESTIADYYQSLTPSFFNFDAADAEGRLVKTARGTGKAANFVKSMVDYQESFKANNPEYIDAVFITNHDMARVANNLMSDDKNIRFVAGLLSTMSGNTFLYYGEEIGMKSKGTKDENKRLPMRWSSSDTKGIPNPPKDADQDVEQTFEGVSEQLKADDSILNYYRKAYNLRLKYPEIARGNITVLDNLTDGHQAVIRKDYEDTYIFVAYNTSDEVISVNISEISDAKKKICESLNMDATANRMDGDVLIMQPKSITYFK